MVIYHILVDRKTVVYDRFRRGVLNKEEREKMQTKVEKLHRAWTKDRDYLAPPTVGKLADLDPAQLVGPLSGFEIGYVPIATRQEQDTSRSVKSSNR